MSSNNNCPSDTTQINSGGSDTARLYKGTAAEQHRTSTTQSVATPTTAPSGSTVRDNRPTNTPGSAVRS